MFIEESIPLEEQKMIKPKIKRAFLSYSSLNHNFVINVAQHLLGSIKRVFYFHAYQKAGEKFPSTIIDEICNCDVAIVFVDKNFENSKWQKNEADAIVSLKNKKDELLILLVKFPEISDLPKSLLFLENYQTFEIKNVSEKEAYDLAIKICKCLNLPPNMYYDLPYDPHLFSYEKDIIKYYIEKNKLSIRNDIELQKLKNETNINDYLKIKKYIEFINDKTINGCPLEWPKVTKWVDEKFEPTQNLLVEIGEKRKSEANVLSAALSHFNPYDDMVDRAFRECMIQNELVFPEAGPRNNLIYPRKGYNLRVGILVSGGIAPGINAVIDGITQRHETYALKHKYSVSIYGLKNGFYAFEDLSRSYVMLRRSGTPGPSEIVTSEHASEGGSIIGTSRVDSLSDESTRLRELEKIVTQIFNWRINILYIIGGDGSMKAAHAIWSFAKNFANERNMPYHLSVVAVPKTMDNDILWVWQTFGFLSAVERARHVIETLSTEAKSNPRLGIIQLFGSDSGFVVSHAVLASSTSICDAALIPEVDFNMKDLAKGIERKIMERGERFPYGLIVMAETAIPTDALDFVDNSKKPFFDVGLTNNEKNAIREFIKLKKSNRRIQGQTNDHLRSAGLKIVSRGLPLLLPKEQKIGIGRVRVDWEKLRIFTNEPRHLLRAIPPSSIDMIFANRLGTLAVDNALAGYTDFMISQWLTEYVLIPLKLVVLGRKRIPKSGIFWKSVLSKTDQPIKTEKAHNEDEISNFFIENDEINVFFKDGKLLKIKLDKFLKKFPEFTDSKKEDLKIFEIQNDSSVYWPNLEKTLFPSDFWK